MDLIHLWGSSVYRIRLVLEHASACALVFFLFWSCCAAPRRGATVVVGVVVEAAQVVVGAAVVAAVVATARAVLAAVEAGPEWQSGGVACSVASGLPRRPVD